MSQTHTSLILFSVVLVNGSSKYFKENVLNWSEPDSKQGICLAALLLMVIFKMFTN